MTLVKIVVPVCASAYAKIAVESVKTARACAKTAGKLVK